MLRIVSFIPFLGKSKATINCFQNLLTFKQIHKMVKKQSDYFLSLTQDSNELSESVSFIEKSGLHTTNSLQFIKQRNWILSNFPKDTRYETVLISSRE